MIKELIRNWFFNKKSETEVAKAGQQEKTFTRHYANTGVARSTTLFAKDPEELRPVYEQARQTWEQAIAEGSFEKSQEACELFKKAAGLPEARSFFTHELEQVIQMLAARGGKLAVQMINDPSTFIQCASLSDRHFQLLLNAVNEPAIANVIPNAMPAAQKFGNMQY